MSEKNRLVSDFYEMRVKQIMDRRFWDLPLIEEKEDILHVLSILGGRSHIWVIKDKELMNLVGVITEHDILSILAPKQVSSYVFGLPNIRSIRHGTAKTARDIMTSKVVTCKPEDKIIDALNKMLEYELRRLPVVHDDKLIGELTLHHLIRKYYAATQYHPIVDEEK